MNPISRSIRSLASIAACLAVASPVLAQPHAKNPLPRPRFSIDLASPSIVTPPLVGAHDVLEKGGMFAVISIAGADLGLLPGEDINALSTANPPVPFGVKFNILFTVDRDSVGAVPPLNVVAAQFPYNVLQQAALNQAAGDEFMALAYFDKGGVIPLGNLNNNTLVANQCDVGGVDHGLLPAVGPDDPVGSPLLTDDLNAHFRGPLGAPLYFSVVGSNDILCDPDGDDGVPMVVLYADASVLGIDPADDVDALTVFDLFGDCVFDSDDDQIIFSLQRGNATGFSGADLLTTPPGPAPGPFLFAPANALGLLNTDNVSSVTWQQTEHQNDLLQILDDIAIRPFPIPTLSEWGLMVLAAGLVVVGGQVIRRRARFGV